MSQKTAKNNEIEASRALQIAKEHQIPEECQSLNIKQLDFCEVYVNTLNMKEACRFAGYTYTYGTQLLRDVRIQVYIHHLRQIYESVSIISKGQIAKKLGERILSNDIKDNDLASLAREARYLLNYGDSNPTMQINIKLPDTYNQFFATSDKDIEGSEDDTLKEQKSLQTNKVVDDWE